LRCASLSVRSTGAQKTRKSKSGATVDNFSMISSGQKREFEKTQLDQPRCAYLDLRMATVRLHLAELAERKKAQTNHPGLCEGAAPRRLG
jgi:hypothetical protein